MSNWPLMLQPLAKYAEFNGRSRRSEFWLWILFRILLGMALGTVALMTVFSGINFEHPEPEQFMGRYFTIMPLFSLINIGLFIPTLAVAVRRLHDIGRTGWWIVMPIVVMVVGMTLFFIIFGTQLFPLITSGQEHMSDEQGLKFVMTMFGSMFLCVFLPILIAEIVMLVFYVTEGKRGPNRFGNDPKGPALNDTP